MDEPVPVFPASTAKTLWRPFTVGDAQAKAVLDNDPTIRRNLGQASNLAADIREFDAQEFGLVAVVNRSTGEIVGYAKLQARFWEKRSGLEIVVAIGAHSRRQGFGLDAARMLIDVACGPLRESTAVGRVAAGNLASLRLVKKLEMVKVGERDDFWDGRQDIYERQCSAHPDNPSLERSADAAAQLKKRSASSNGVAFQND